MDDKEMSGFGEEDLDLNIDGVLNDDGESDEDDMLLGIEEDESY